MIDRRDTRSTSVWLAELKLDIAKRLRPVCQNMPDAEFDALVDEIAAVNLKYRGRRVDDMMPGKKDE